VTKRKKEEKENSVIEKRGGGEGFVSKNN